MEVNQALAEALSATFSSPMYPETDDTSTAYLVHYKWEWFARESWQPTFRVRKRRSTQAFLAAVKSLGLEGELILDASCGLGLRTIVLAEAGLLVHGADRCEIAVQHARKLVAEEGLPKIPFSVTSWESLSADMQGRFGAAYTDGMWDVESDEAMVRILIGLRGALRPGGILAYEGARPGGSSTENDAIEIEWNHRTGSSGRFSIGLTAAHECTSVVEVKVLERSGHWLDQHHLFVVSEGAAARLEQARMRHYFLQWSGKRMAVLLEAAGFRCIDWIPGNLQRDGVRDVVVLQRG